MDPTLFFILPTVPVSLIHHRGKFGDKHQNDKCTYILSHLLPFGEFILQMDNTHMK